MTWLTVLSWLRKVPTWAWAALGLAVCLMVMRSHWIGVGESRVQAVLDAERAANKLAADAQKAEAAAKEAKDAAAFALLADNLRKENERAKQDADRTIADLRRGAIRLRDRFTCKSTVPAAAGSPARSDEAGQGGFTVEDASIALRIASDGDAAIRQLTACQAILSAERQ
jgi:hypothetical protein